MASRRFDYLFAVASLLLLLAAQGPSAEARSFKGVNRWCRTAFYRRVCTRMVNGSITQDEATTNALKATLGYAKRLQGMVDMVKPDIEHLDQNAQKGIMSRCSDSLERTVDDLEKSIDSMASIDYGSVLARLSAALQSDCKTALSEYRIESRMDDYLKLLHIEVDNTLAIISQN